MDCFAQYISDIFVVYIIKICIKEKLSLHLHHQKRDESLLASVDPVAQSVEHNTFNVGVPGSSPGGITEEATIRNGCRFFCFIGVGKNSLG